MVWCCEALAAAVYCDRCKRCVLPVPEGRARSRGAVHRDYRVQERRQARHRTQGVPGHQPRDRAARPREDSFEGEHTVEAERMPEVVWNSINHVGT